MLLKGIAGLSLVISLVSAAVMHVFYGFPLWLAPLLYAADCLILFLLAFLFLCIVCALVDLNKPQEEDSRFYRAVMHLYIEALITLVRLKVDMQARSTIWAYASARERGLLPIRSRLSTGICRRLNRAWQTPSTMSASATIRATAWRRTGARRTGGF